VKKNLTSFFARLKTLEKTKNGAPAGAPFKHKESA